MPRYFSSPRRLLALPGHLGREECGFVQPYEHPSQTTKRGLYAFGFGLKPPRVALASHTRAQLSKNLPYRLGILRSPMNIILLGGLGYAEQVCWIFTFWFCFRPFPGSSAHPPFLSAERRHTSGPGSPGQPSRGRETPCRGPNSRRRTWSSQAAPWPAASARPAPEGVGMGLKQREGAAGWGGVFTGFWFNGWVSGGRNKDRSK